MLQPDPTEIAALLVKSREHFFVFDETDQFADLKIAMDKLPEAMRQIAETYKGSLLGAATTLTMPYQMMFGHSLIESKFHLEQSGSLVGDFQQYVRFNPSVWIEAGQRAMIRVEMLRSHSAVDYAAGELLRQGVILFWSSFEVLARDLFVALLNAQPQMTERLMAENAATKKYFKDAKLADVIREHGFDLSSKMGEVFDHLHQLDSLNRIKEAYRLLFPEADNIRLALADEDLRILHERRNLIVHRKGVIDRSYNERVPSDGLIGARLNVSPADIDRYFLILERVGRNFLEEASRGIIV